MKDRAKTKEQLVEELSILRCDLADLKRQDAERRGVEEASQRTVSLLTSTVDLTADGILVVDKNGELILFNKKFLSLWRIPESLAAEWDDDQLLNYVLCQLSDPGSFIEKVKQLYSQPEAESLDVLEFKDGRVFERFSRPQRLGNDIAGRVWCFRDVTDRRRAEEEQRRSQEIAEQLAEEMAVVAEIGRLISSTLNIGEVYERFAVEAKKLIPFDRLAVNLKIPHEDTITVAYVSGLDVPGRRPGDTLSLKGSFYEVLAGKRAGLLIHPESMGDLAGVSNRGLTFKAGIRSAMSIPLISRDEVIGALHFRSKKTNAYTERDLRLAERIGAQIAGAIANAQLFTDLKKTEMSLRESERRFRGLVEQAAVGVAEIDTNTGRFLTVNRRLCEMVGRTEEEMLGSTFLTITHPEDLHLHEEKRALLLAGKIGHYSLEKRYLRKDGETVWVNVAVSPLWKPGEKPWRNMTVVEDITERKRMEAEMQEMSLRDLLTGLYNRRGFITLAEQQLKAANRAQRPLQLTFIDCDNLKGINDTLGHKEGDKALIDAAHILRQTFRESDIIARMGGDEFATLSIDAADMNHEGFSRRLQQHIDACNAEESRQYKLSLSWGTAIYNPESPISLDQLISAADESMYAWKKAKSNRQN